MMRVFLVLLLGLSGCSPAGVREWAGQVQNQAATGFAEQQAAGELKAWERAGVSGGTYNPRAEAAAKADKADAAAPEAPAAATPQPRYIYVLPAR